MSPPYIPGYGALGEALRETQKARLYQYHRKTVWVPKSLVRVENDAHYAPTYVLRAKA